MVSISNKILIFFEELTHIKRAARSNKAAKKYNNVLLIKFSNKMVPLNIVSETNYQRW